MSIPADDSTSSISDDAAVEALMGGLNGPSDANEDADENEDADDGEDEDDDDRQPAADEDDDADEGDDDQGDDDGDEGDEGEGDPAPAGDPKAAADDQVVEVTVDGVTSKVTVASLKRLAGQEASLTRKSQEADTVGSRAAAALTAALELAQEDLAPYADVDWLVLQNQIDPAEFEWHRGNAAKAQARFDKLIGAAGSVDQVLGARRQNATVEQAQNAVRELQADIPDWSDKLYGDIIAFGVREGLPEDDVKAITNPKIIKLLRKAMLHDAGAKAVATKVKTVPTKVVKPSRNTVPEGKAAIIKKSTARLQSGRGTDADAIAILAGRWS